MTMYPQAPSQRNYYKSFRVLYLYADRPLNVAYHKLEAADAIILMPNGRMEATGGFEKLVQSCKIFSLILSQA